MLKLDRDYLAAEIAGLNAIIDSLPQNDFLSRMSLESRRRRVQEELKALSDVAERSAKVALYFAGDPVIGSIGIEAEFGTRALGEFQDLLTKVWAAEDGALSSMGPVADKEHSRLHITNLVHGSFGFMLEEINGSAEPLFETPLTKAAGQVTQYLSAFADESESRFVETIQELDERVFRALRDFFGEIHKAGATFRLVEGENDEKFDRYAVERAWMRAEMAKVDEKNITRLGKLLGIIPFKRRFEFEADGETKIIEGTVNAKFSEAYLKELEKYTGRRWKASFHKRIVEKAGSSSPIEKYTLLELSEISEQQ